MSSAERAVSDAKKVASAQFKELGRLAAIDPPAPPALLFRVWRWFAATFTRELAWQLALIQGVVLGIGRKLGIWRAGRLGRIAGFGLLAACAHNLAQAAAAQRSLGAIDEALGDLPETDGPGGIPKSHLVLPALAFFAPEVTRERGRIYAEVEGERLRLDIYRPKEMPPGPRPAVIQIHGGGWLAGSRYEQGIPLLNHMASLGWVGFNIDYRLSPEATWPAQIVDVKRAIAWVRENAEELGVDPDRIAITGGSAGGHLTALAALTENDPAFQPGFEDSDTWVMAAVPFYGIYDMTNANNHYYPELRDWAFEKVLFKQPFAENRELYRSASPIERVHPGAPPFLVIHGERDTLVPVGDARDFVAVLREVSGNDVRYVELAGAEHAFDLWPSVRTAGIAEGIGRFLEDQSRRRNGLELTPGIL